MDDALDVWVLENTYVRCMCKDVYLGIEGICINFDGVPMVGY